MDHNRPVFFAVTPPVYGIEPLGEIKIDLNGAALPCSVQRVLYLYIYLGPVENTFSGVYNIRQSFLLKRLLQGIRSMFPVFKGPHKFLRSGRKIYIVRVKSKGPKNKEREIKYVYDFPFNLVLHAEYMRIILCKAPHPHKSVQRSGSFVPVYRTEFCIPQRQVPVAPELTFIYVDVERTIHRLQLIGNLVDFHRGVHVFPVKVPVTAFLPQMQPGNMRGKKEFI